MNPEATSYPQKMEHSTGRHKKIKTLSVGPQTNIEELLTQCNNNQMQLRSRNNLKLPKRFQVI